MSRCVAIALVILALAVSGCSRPATAPPPATVETPGHEPSHARTHEHRHHGGHHRFEDADEWAKQFDDPARDEWQRPDEVVAWIGLEPAMTVADLGAGTGYFAVRFARAVPEGNVVANDIEPDMIRFLRERATREGLTNLTPVQGRPDDPALEGDVDVAFLCDVYHHIADRERFFGSVRARLGVSGRLIVVDFKKDAPPDAPGPPAAMRVAVDQVARELAAVGFRETRRDEDMLPYQYVVEITPG